MKWLIPIVADWLVELIIVSYVKVIDFLERLGLEQSDYNEKRYE